MNITAWIMFFCTSLQAIIFDLIFVNYDHYNQSISRKINNKTFFIKKG